jgi:hypothetical protein
VLKLLVKEAPRASSERNDQSHHAEDPLLVEEATEATTKRAKFWEKLYPKLLVKEVTKVTAQRALFSSEKHRKQPRRGPSNDSDRVPTEETWSYCLS